MQMTQRDLENFTKRFSLFAEIDKEVQSIYDKIKERGIEIKTPGDIERVDRFFLPTVKRIVKLIENNKQFDDFIKGGMKNASIIDVFVRFCENYGFDPATTIPSFGKEAETMFKNAQKNMDLRP